MSIIDFLGLFGPRTAQAGTAPPGPEADTIRRIVASLERLEPARARKIAAFAFILSRAAQADMKISKEETCEMERLVVSWGNLPEEQAVLVVEIAKCQNTLFGGTDNFIVTREFGRNATREEKVELLHCLFAVSAADDSISVTEENTVSQIAKELGFTQREFVEIRSFYREKRAVMKDLPR
ncbi:MAG TPA: TerB family tellurite resistance protein [Candidatus Polarisedimenticolia bacterium]